VWIPCISTNSTIIYAPRVRSMSQYSSCAFNDHSIVFEPCFAPCFLKIPKNELYRREGKTPLEYSILPHLTVAWTVWHEINPSQLVPSFRTNVSYTPYSICLHAVQSQHFTEIFDLLLSRGVDVLPMFRTTYRPHIQGSSNPNSSWTAKTSVNNYQFTPRPTYQKS
jgi:hypothetical protein